MPTDPMPADLILRPALAGDVPRLVEVMRSAREVAPMPDLGASDREVGAHLAARLGTEEVWVADDGDEVLGYARCTATWLDDLYVAPSAQEQGVGTALLDLVKALRPEGFCLWAFGENTPARGFYAHRGLIELEPTDGSENAEGAPEVRMAWPGERPLEFLRGLIDEVDDEIAALLARRVALTAAVQQAKPVGGNAGRDGVREREIVERMAAKVPSLGPERVQRIVHTVISESLDAAGS